MRISLKLEILLEETLSVCDNENSANQVGAEKNHHIIGS